VAEMHLFTWATPPRNHALAAAMMSVRQCARRQGSPPTRATNAGGMLPLFSGW